MAEKQKEYKNELTCVCIGCMMKSVKNVFEKKESTRWLFLLKM